MANAKKDENGVSTRIGVLDSNGSSISLLKVNPANHAAKVDDNTTGSNNGPTPARALKDENDVSTMLVQSSAGDGALVPLYVNSSGMLLINTK